MNRSLVLTAVFSSALTSLAFRATGVQAQQPAAGGVVKLENDRVKVTELVYQPGAPRERHVRPADQVIVFLDDSRYERTDSATKEKTVRERKAGDVIWHNKGEDAPVLVNMSPKPYRTLVIELKK